MRINDRLARNHAIQAQQRECGYRTARNGNTHWQVAKLQRELARREQHIARIEKRFGLAPLPGPAKRTVATGRTHNGKTEITVLDPAMYRKPRSGTHEQAIGEIMQQPSAMQRLTDAIPGIQQRAFDRAMTGS